VSLLTVRGLRGGYGRSEVLHGVDLEVAPGGATAVLGANGAGKTTLLRAITRAIRSAGEVVFDGHDLARLRTDRIARLGVAHVPEGRGTLAGLSVRDNLMAGALTRRDRSGVGDDLERCLDLFAPLRERSGQSAASLSGGEQQMLAISRALMGRPRLLLLDEPSLGLAPRVTRELFAVLKQLRDQWGTALLIVEQNAALALDLADAAVVLESGRVTLDGPADEVAGHDEVRRAYLGI
jgi:branched-chain amino acid transport system ATP-binding protein